MADSIDNAIREGEPPPRPARALLSEPKRVLKNPYIVVVGTLLAVTLAICILPGELCRVCFGRPYITPKEYREIRDKIKPGMTADEVETTIGVPHEKIRGGDGTASWWIYYMRSSLSPLIDGHVGVEFDRNGRVRTVFEDH